MAINTNSVLKIAQLAKLELTTSEVEKYSHELSNILALVDKMDSVDTSKVEVMTHPFDATLRLRSDTVTANNMRSELQSLAPDAENGLYRVPKVID